MITVVVGILWLLLGPVWGVLDWRVGLTALILALILDVLIAWIRDRRRKVRAAKLLASPAVQSVADVIRRVEREGDVYKPPPLLPFPTTPRPPKPHRGRRT